MVPREITLAIYDLETGREDRVAVASRRFTIGRSPENDLAIEDSNLSRRHAVIESFDGSALISDCGSQNGTFVNGNPVVGAVALQDGDLITLGGSQEITVEMRSDSGAGAETGYISSPAAQAPFHNPPPAFNQNNSLPAEAAFSLSPPVIAGAAVVLILLVAGVFLLLNRNPTPTPPRKFDTRVVENQDLSPTPRDPDVSPPSPPSNNEESPANLNMNVPPDSAELRLIEKNVRIVMSSISNDSSPFVPSDVVGEVSEQVKRYRGSSVLRDQIRSMKHGGISQLGAAAKTNDIKLPLVVFAALAKLGRDGERGDPAAMAQAMLPTLSKLRIIWGTELANDSLLIVATYDQPASGSFHPLQFSISKFAKDQHESVSKIRTPWYLYKHQKINSRAYELVLRFLAVGVIAQDPHHFDIDAEPLVF